MIYKMRRAVSAVKNLAEERLFSLISYRERRNMKLRAAALLVLISLFSITGLTWEAGDMARWLATPDGNAAYLFWIGNKSIFDLVTGAVTTFIAFGAVFLALQSYRVNQRAAVANRYQKGVELLSSAADSSKLGGIELLSVAAHEAPSEYQVPMIRTLRQFLEERCAANMEATRRNSQSHDTAAPNGTDLVVMAALSAVARTSWRRRWIELEYDNEGLTLRGVYLHNVRIVSYDFSRIRFEDSIIGDVSFIRCVFNETLIDARLFGKLFFHNCSIDRLDIQAADLAGEQLVDTEAFIHFSGERRQSIFRFNGQWAPAKN